MKKPYKWIVPDLDVALVGDEKDVTEYRRRNGMPGFAIEAMLEAMRLDPELLASVKRLWGTGK